MKVTSDEGTSVRPVFGRTDSNQKTIEVTAGETHYMFIRLTETHYVNPADIAQVIYSTASGFPHLEVLHHDSSRDYLYNGDLAEEAWRNWKASQEPSEPSTSEGEGNVRG